MKAQKLTAFCSAVLVVLVEAMVFGGDVAASAQGVPQQFGAGSSNSAMAGDFGKRHGRHKKHRRHRGGKRKHAMNRMGNNGNQGLNSSSPWAALNGQKGNGAANGNFKQGKRHKRHRGGRKRRNMQTNGMDGGAGSQFGGQFGQ